MQLRPRCEAWYRAPGGTGLRVRPAAGGSLGAGAPDRLFREVHRDTFADGMAVFCNANGRREDSRIEERVEQGVSQVRMGIKQLESRERERRGACHRWEEAPTWSPRLGPSSPIPTPPPPSPEALPLLQRTPQPLPECARVLFVTERIIRIMASRPAATVVLPGPRVSLAPRRFGAPYARGSRGSS